MKTAASHLAFISGSGFPPAQFTILFEDDKLRDWAKTFAAGVARGMDAACILLFWPCELLESKAGADAVRRAALKSDYLIVSIRADRFPSAAVRSWLEEIIRNSGAAPTGLILLLESFAEQHCIAPQLADYFGALCAERGVSLILSHTANFRFADRATCLGIGCA